MILLDKMIGQPFQLTLALTSLGFPPWKTPSEALLVSSTESLRAEYKIGIVVIVQRR